MSFRLGIFLVALLLIESYGFREELDLDWYKFKTVFRKQYSESEEKSRRIIFEKHVDLIASHNRDYDLGLSSYTLGLNEYADLSNAEFRKLMNGFRSENLTFSNLMLPLKINPRDLPSSVDWRTKGVVTKIKNQGQCGSCWSFSSTGSIEGQYTLKTGKLANLSEQNLIDCSRKYGNEGCNGGWMDQAFKYVIKNHGIDTEASYPYQAKDGKCRFNKGTVGAKISKYVDVASGSELALQEAVANVGPISVAIDASSEDFQLYKSGIFNPKRCSKVELDHAVLVVGYGTQQKGDYWIVKNSWGTTWGMEGYILMSRNKNNQCGIASKASYPLV